MRWLFLLLLVLNVFYYIWNQQEAPLRAKDVTPLSLYRGSQQDIRLLSETADAVARRERSKSGEADTCLYVGGFARKDTALMVEQRLAGLNIKARLESSSPGDSEGYWLRVAPQSRRLLDEQLLQNLAKEFNELKHKINPCEGVATTQ